jgi:hypothetical protein
VDTILLGKTCGQRQLALEEASRVTGTDDGKAEVDAGRPPRRARSPSQEKVKQEMMAKARQPLPLAGTAQLVRDMGPKVKKPASLARGLRALPISK